MFHLNKTSLTKLLHSNIYFFSTLQNISQNFEEILNLSTVILTCPS